MIMQIISNIFSYLKDFIFLALKVLAGVIIPFIISCIGFYIYFRYIKKMKPPKRTKEPIFTQDNILKRLYIDFPRRLILDKLTLNPDRYNETGIYIFEGEQGSGKTISAIHYVKTQIEKNPLATFSANLQVEGQKELLEDWRQIVATENGIYGQLNLIDEIQNWFNSNESRDINVEFIGEICMQRKQAKAIIGTTQHFNRMCKQLRQETTYIMRPMTIAGCLTIVRQYKPTIDIDGQLKKMKLLRTYFFVHTDELRNSYDTYSKIKRISHKGFKDHSFSLLQ